MCVNLDRHSCRQTSRRTFGYQALSTRPYWWFAPRAARHLDPRCLAKAGIDTLRGCLPNFPLRRTENETDPYDLLLERQSAPRYEAQRLRIPSGVEIRGRFGGFSRNSSL